MSVLRELMATEEVGLRQAKKWGYTLGSQDFCLSEKNDEKKEYFLANIQLRNFAPNIPKTDQIREIEAQIRTIQNQRILMQLNEKRDNKDYDPLTGKSDLTRMVEHKIQEYNDIIDHLHLIKSSQKQQLNKRKISFRNAFVDILEQIQEQKSKLAKVELEDKISINQKIINLYKQCKEKFNVKNSYSPSRKNTSNSIKIPINIYSLNKTQPIFKIKKRKKHIQATINKPSNVPQNEQDTQADANFKRKQNRIERHIEISRKVYNQCQEKTLKRIEAIQNKLMNKKGLTQKKNKNFLRRLKQIESIIQDKIHLSSFQNQNSSNDTHISFRSNYQEKKEKIIADWLAKRSPKFNKISGTKILLKYDSHAEAKSMLEGTLSKDIKPIYQEQKQAYFLPENEEESNYWRTCKTEKINLLLKTKK